MSNAQAIKNYSEAICPDCTAKAECADCAAAYDHAAFDMAD